MKGEVVMTVKDIWAEALNEAENPEMRNGGLWARSFAQADGDENKAKAAYIRSRVQELEAADANVPPPPSKKTTGWCPNCQTECAIDSTECPKCRSSFASDSIYKLLDRKPENAQPSIQKNNGRGWCPVCHEPIDLDALYCSACNSNLAARHLSPLKYKPTSPAPNAQQGHSQNNSYSPRGVQIVQTAKSRGTYIILGILFGMLGIHNFYAGRYLRGALQLCSTCILGWFVIGLVITAFWVLIDLFTVTEDSEGIRLT